MSQFDLLRQRRLGPLFWTQFLGAFNDNLFKNALIILITFAGTARSSDEVALLVNLSAGIFILPFFLFSATAGQVADKVEKSCLIRRVKQAEILIMLLAAVGFSVGSVSMLMGVLFLMGTQSAVFGPVKYAILPQHLREEELVGGNGLIEMGTFVAILLGTLLGTQLPAWLVSWCVVAVALLGYAASRRVPEAPSNGSLRIGWNVLAETVRIVRFARETRAVFLSILGISWFWFFGALFLAQLPMLSTEVLHGDPQVVGILLAAFSVGIGTGSLLCERLSGDVVELGLVPFGSIGLTLFGIDLYFALQGVPPAAETIDAAAFLASSANLHVLADLVLLGVFGGFYIVPLYAVVQQRSRASHRSRIIAGNNVLNALFMVAASLIAIGLRRAGLGIPELLLFTCVLNAAVAAYIYTLLPEFLMRFLIWILVHTIYRVDKRGLEHLPAEGPAVVVANHVSFVDAPIIAAMCRRPIRFVMDHRIYRIPVLHFIFKTGRAIPIAPKHRDEALMERAFDEIARALEEGDVVCIFPEGKITADGDMNPFRPGIERILERSPVPVVPMALRGLWGSFFSREGGSAMSRPFRRFHSRIQVACDAPLEPVAATAAVLQDRVAALRGDWR